GMPECLVVHHMGHVLAGDASRERARGDSRLRDWPDVEWRLIRADEDPASPRFITAYGRDVDVPECALSYDAATRRLTLAGGSRRDAGVEEALTDVISLLRIVGEPASGRRLKSGLADSDHSRRLIEAALKLGVKTGRLVVEDGPRHSRLFRQAGSDSVSRSVPAVNRDTASECPTPLKGWDTRTLDFNAPADRADRDTQTAEAPK